MSLDDLGDGYDYKDLIPQVKDGLSVDGKMYAAPFYAESSFTYYRKDLFEKAGITMPEKPTYAQIAEYADKLTDKKNGIYGICLRGKPGWGENMAFLGTAVNAFGGEWFDMKWQPQLTSQPWKDTIAWYLDVMKKDGPPGPTANGFNENQALFASGKCGMWIDATSGAGRVYDPKQSQVADKIAFTAAPVTDKNPKASGWFWSWNLAIPTSTKKADAAKKFVAWATSKDYVKLVGETEGWVAAPPGTRLSTYDNPEYQKAAPFAATVLKAIETTDPQAPDRQPGPLYRRAVRRHPRVPGHRHQRRPGYRGGAGRPGHGRGRPEEGPGHDRAHHEAGRLSQVGRRPTGAGASCPGAATIPGSPQAPAGRPPCRLQPCRATRPPPVRCGRSKRGVDTRPLVWPSIAALLVWMIVPLALTLYFSLRNYNLTDPTVHGLGGPRPTTPTC